MGSSTRPTEPELFQLEEHYARKARRTRLYFGAALIAAIAITAVVAVSLSGSSNKSKTHPTGLPSVSAVVTAGPPTPATSMPVTQPSPGSDADMSTVIFNGATLPVSKTSGPRVMNGGLASGFAETPLGAALAAVHIGYRLDPSVGVAVYTATAQQQTVGDSAALIKEIQSTPIAPESGPLAEYVGYRIADYSTTAVVTVHLEAITPGTADGRDVPINVEWSNGDWKLVLPLPSSVGALGDPTTYTRF